MKNFFKKLWSGWKRFALVIGRANTILLLTLFYFLILVPVGLVFRLFGWDPLSAKKKKHQNKSSWQKVPVEQPDLQSLERQS